MVHRVWTCKHLELASQADHQATCSVVRRHTQWIRVCPFHLLPWLQGVPMVESYVHPSINPLCFLLFLLVLTPPPPFSPQSSPGLLCSSCTCKPLFSSLSRCSHPTFRF